MSTSWWTAGTARPAGSRWPSALSATAMRRSGGERTSMTTLDVARIKKDFPLLDVEVNGRPIVYLDSANSTQKPRPVIDAMTRFMETAYAPINRSAYRLAAEATEAYEGARRKGQQFINAPRPHELVFTKNATEGLNLVAYSWARANLRPGDTVVLTHMEHHANVVPW